MEIKDIPTIFRSYPGGSEEVSFAYFWEYVIQDYDAGLDCAQGMLQGDGTATANDDQPEFYEEYQVLDPDVLAEQIRLEEMFE